MLYHCLRTSMSFTIKPVGKGWIMRKYFEVEDDVQNICLDCHHVGFTHAEHEIDGQEEAEVVCPKCYSTYYFVISDEEKASA